MTHTVGMVEYRIKVVVEVLVEELELDGWQLSWYKYRFVSGWWFSSLEETCYYFDIKKIDVLPMHAESRYEYWQ